MCISNQQKTFLKKYPVHIPTKCGSKWPSGFSGQIYKQKAPYLTPLSLLFLLCSSDQRNNLLADHSMSIPTKVGSNWLCGFRDLQQILRPLRLLFLLGNQKEKIKVSKWPSTEHSYRWANVATVSEQIHFIYADYVRVLSIYVYSKWKKKPHYILLTE